MASIGLAKSYYAKYNVSDQGVISYTDGGLLGKAVEAQIELDGNDPSKFFADNGPAESALSFTGGTLTITNDRLSLSPVAALLGLTTAPVTTPSGTHLSFPADINPPYVGYGTVKKDIIDGVTSYMSIILYKVQFRVPALDVTTQGETVEFNGQEFTATIMRNDATPALWMDWGVFTSETDAVSYVKAALGIS